MINRFNQVLRNGLDETDTFLKENWIYILGSRNYTIMNKRFKKEFPFCSFSLYQYIIRLLEIENE